jgi:hypothetical protein
MNRRDFFKYSTTTLVLSPITIKINAVATIENQIFPTSLLSQKLVIDVTSSKTIKDKKKIILPNEKKIVLQNKVTKKIIKNTKNIFLDEKHVSDFISVKEKLTLLQKYIGYGNFNIISFDDMLRFSKRSSHTKAFSKNDIAFLEEIFYYNPTSHGFYGERVSKNITDKINKKDVIKIPKTGHYLFRGESERIYQKMIDDVGNSLTLTSGVRSVVKQTKLFLDKLASTNGNMSIASKSLAPPAFTYHSIADFDVGKKGFGRSNFTSRFAFTKEFLTMRKLKYIDMRYTINNKDGVRYEPWHVKVI